MARPVKQGLQYFPFDVDFFADVKVRKIARACGPNSTSILICLLCNIYKDEGYYILWDDDLPFVIADIVGVSEGAVIEVIKKGIQVDFFHKELSDRYKILTSASIQRRFFAATYKRKEISVKEEYLINDVNNSVNDVNNSVNDTQSTQSKVKERKEKENKEKVSPSRETPSHHEKVDFKRFIDYFNSTFEGTTIPQIRNLNDTRKKALQARVDEYGKDAIAFVFQKILASNFLLGRTKTDRKWICGFDFIFSPSGFLKIYEGTYDNEKSDAQVRNERANDARETRNRLQAEKIQDMYANSIDYYQLGKLRSLAASGDETAKDILSGKVRMDKAQISDLLKSFE